MTPALDERAFQIAYREALEAVPHAAALSYRLPASNDRISRRGYLAACELLYVQALGLLREQGAVAWPRRVLDAGGTFGIVSAALRSLGVAVVDDGADGDPVDLVLGLALHDQTATAELIAARGARLSRPAARLVLVVPSSHYWNRQLARLRRRATTAHEDATVELGTPSFTRSQLHRLLHASELRPERVLTRDYTPASIGGPLRQIVGGSVTRLAPRHREVWVVLASASSGT